MQKAVREAVAESAAAVADYKAGSERALNFVVGLVMKKTRGKADAGEVAPAGEGRGGEGLSPQAHQPAIFLPKAFITW